MVNLCLFLSLKHLHHFCGQSDESYLSSPGSGMESRKGKEKRLKGTIDESSKTNMRWNVEMDRALGDVLRDQRNIGNKGDGGWKAIAYNTASSILSAQFKANISADHVRNRVKHWKRIHGIVSGVLSESGLNWDSSKHMINIDDESVWAEYVKVHEEASTYRYKVIPNWDDIVDLCGKDRATGEGAETALEADEVMSTETSSTQDICDLTIGDTQAQKKRGPSSSASLDPPLKKKVGIKDDLASAVTMMATSLHEFMHQKKLSVDDVYEEVNAIPNLDRRDRLRALNWLVDNENKFYMLKKLPVEEKKDFLLMSLP